MHKQEKIIWKFQWWDNFGFLIPRNRDYFWWDFFVSKKNFWWAKTWDTVEWLEIKSTWKKPEVKIIKVFWEKVENKDVYVEWIYSEQNKDFWFVDIPEEKKWYFVHKQNRLAAKDWDKVKAKLVRYKWKQEAEIVKVFESEFENLEWVFKDNDSFWFVVTKDKWDIFIPWFKKNWAKTWDKVEVKVVKEWKKNKEGIVIKILE